MFPARNIMYFIVARSNSVSGSYYLKCYGVVTLNTEKTEVKLCMLLSALLVFLLIKSVILFYVIGQQYFL